MISIALIDKDLAVCTGGRWRNWLFRRHPLTGKFISWQRLDVRDYAVSDEYTPSLSIDPPDEERPHYYSVAEDGYEAPGHD